MARPKKTKINLDKSSLQEFMQEIYNDCVNVMNSARKELNERKNRADIDDINDESLIGKVNNETLKILDSAIDKKIALAKLQSQIVTTDSKGDNKENGEERGLSEKDKDILRDIFTKKNDSDNIKYELD
tara:strand:+ start:416 stop:802 length:387 start_codon:yes stop_codon:yes gene_type:complete